LKNLAENYEKAPNVRMARIAKILISNIAIWSENTVNIYIKEAVQPLFQGMVNGNLWYSNLASCLEWVSFVDMKETLIVLKSIVDKDKWSMSDLEDVYIPKIYSFLK